MVEPDSPDGLDFLEEKQLKSVKIKDKKFSFEVPENFQVIEPVGVGAYGIVVSAIDKELKARTEADRKELLREIERGEISADEYDPADDDPSKDGLVAIKKIEKVFDHKIYAQRTLRELKIQRLLQHENILSINKIILPDSKENFRDIKLVTPLMHNDLGALIQSEQEISEQHVRFFTYCILRGLKYIHSAGILHRDLKPRNILFDSDGEIMICDFGMARPEIPELQTNSFVLTDYIATRWYRAPEVLLSWKAYSAEVDVWSVGCILAEML